jgi:hypothetical protein
MRHLVVHPPLDHRMWPSSHHAQALESLSLDATAVLTQLYTGADGLQPAPPVPGVLPATPLPVHGILPILAWVDYPKFEEMMLTIGQPTHAHRPSSFLATGHSAAEAPPSTHLQHGAHAAALDEVTARQQRCLAALRSALDGLGGSAPALTEAIGELEAAAKLVVRLQSELEPGRA